MPVRIYEIAKKVGISSKEVLAKAKELGITNAKVASSTLDKITAEYLEGKIAGTQDSLVPDAANVAQRKPALDIEHAIDEGAALGNHRHAMVTGRGQVAPAAPDRDLIEEV
jgi:hypothetical protein